MKVKALFILAFLCCWLSGKAQVYIQDNSFKILVGETGLGASYEYNPAKRFYFEGQASSSFYRNRVGVQGKYTLLNSNDNFYIKSGLEAAYMLLVFEFKGIQKPHNFVIMPHFSVEWGEFGLQMSALYDEKVSGNVFQRFSPIFMLTLNVTRSRMNQPTRLKDQNYDY